MFKVFSDRSMVEIPVWIDAVTTTMDCCSQTYDLLFFHSAYQLRLDYWALTMEKQSEFITRVWTHSFDKDARSFSLLVGQRRTCVQCYRKLLGVSRKRWATLFKDWEMDNYSLIRKESKQQNLARVSIKADFWRKYLEDLKKVPTFLYLYVT